MPTQGVGVQKNPKSSLWMTPIFQNLSDRNRKMAGQADYTSSFSDVLSHYKEEEWKLHNPIGILCSCSFEVHSTLFCLQQHLTPQVTTRQRRRDFFSRQIAKVYTKVVLIKSWCELFLQNRVWYLVWFCPIGQFKDHIILSIIYLY